MSPEGRPAMDNNRVPAGEPFPIEEIVSATPEGAEAFRDQSAVLEAAALIRQMRDSAGLTQRSLARLVGTSQPHLSELERGTGTQGPTFLMLQKIAKACGTTLRMEIGNKSESGTVSAEQLADVDANVREILGNYLGAPSSPFELAAGLTAFGQTASARMTDWVLHA